MGLDVEAVLDIDAPPAAVAAIQFDPARDPEWIGGVDRVELQTPDRFGLGSRVLRIGRFLARRIEWLMVVEGYEPDRRVTMHAERSPFPMDVEYRLEPIGDGSRTRARIRIRGEGRGGYAMPAPLLAPVIRRSVTADLRRLRSIVVGSDQGAVTG
jgi:hypothetical protein